MNLLPFQTDHAARLLAALRRAGAALDASDAGCHARGTPILMFDGHIKPIEEVRVGDLVMGWDSTPRTVVALCRGREEMARIAPIKGEPFVVNLSHILTLQYTRFSPKAGLFKRSEKIIDISVRNYLALPVTHRDKLKLFRVPVNPWPGQALPIHPYHLGILLGDGCLLHNHLSFSKPSLEMEFAAGEVAADHGAEIRTRWRNPGNPTHYFKFSSGLWAALESLGVGGKHAENKFIPHRYKTSSFEQRSQILAGLLDTDGHYLCGGYDFISASRELSEDTAFLARSLGLAAYLSPSFKKCQTGAGGIYWRVSISGDCSFLPLRLSRKQAAPRRQIKSVLRTGFRVEMLPPDEYFGFSLTGDGRFCLGDFTVTHNTGKTYVAANTAKRGGWKLAVIAPKATLPTWHRVAEGFGAEVLFISNYESLKLGKTGFGVFQGKEFIWHLPSDALLVVDEAQRCKARDSQNARMLVAARRQGVRTLLCSATAAASPLDMRAIGYCLGLHRLHDFWPWAIAHGCRKGRFGFEFSGNREALERLHHRVFGANGTGSRLRIADIPEFPLTQIIAEPVGTGREREIQSIYDDLARDINIATARGDESRLSEIADDLKARKANHLTVLLRARQKIEALKANAIISMAQDAAAEGMSVAVFLNFDETVHDVAKRIGTNCLIVGGQSDTARAEVISRFQENCEHFIVANIKAGGVGVSLHDPYGKKPRLALISPTYSAQDLRQCLGRVHRTGGAHSIQRIVFAAGTVEERACEAVAAKLACIDLLNDGDLLGPIFG